VRRRGRRKSSGNAFVITRLSNFCSGTRTSTRMPTPRRSLFCLLNPAARWEKRNKLYLFLLMGINYQFHLHSHHLVWYILHPLKHSWLCLNLWWKALKNIRTSEWAGEPWVREASLFFDGFCVRFREQCLYTGAFKEGNLVPIPQLDAAGWRLMVVAGQVGQLLEAYQDTVWHSRKSGTKIER
jgi:hypothetical protein